MGKKREHKSEYDENEYDIAPKSFKEIRATSTKKRLIIILENSQLETVKVIIIQLFFLIFMFFNII